MFQLEKAPFEVYLEQIFGSKWGPNPLKNVRKFYFCESFQDFWKGIRQIINIKVFPYL